MSNDMKLPRLLDTKQVAEMLAVPVWSLRELVRKKKGPPHLRIGRRVRFTEAAVMRWIEDQTSNAKEG